MPKCMPLGFYAWVGMTAIIIAVPIHAQAALISLSDKAISLGDAPATIYSVDLNAPIYRRYPAVMWGGSMTSVAFSGWRTPVSRPRYPDSSLGLLINPPASGVYSASTDTYPLRWLDITSARARVGTADNAFADITTVVSLPVAVWLSGSGLLGMVAVARRKNQSSFFRPLT